MRKKKINPEARAKMAELLKRFKKIYPEAHCALNYETPYQLLAATVLSAQCTDVRVNMVTPALFKKFPDAAAMSKAKLSEVEALIRSTGFFKNKSKSLVEGARQLVEEHQGVVPKTLEALVKIRGVGRKTANVILGNAFGIPGLVVDTHVGRLCRRLGFTLQNNPEKVEKEMCEIVPKNEWTMFSHYLISHGRARCQARKPDCSGCEVAALCEKKI